MKKKILYALLSVVIAIGLWVYVVTVVSPESTETYRNIAVIIDGESLLRDRGLMIVTEKIPSVTLKLSGNRSDLRKLSSSNIVVTVDVSRINNVGTKELQYTISYPGDVPSGSIQVMSQSPERISITVVEAARITVPIEIKSPNKVNDPYWVDSSKISISQERVAVEGPAEVIAKIKSAAVTVDVSNKTETIKEYFDVVLYDADGNVVTNQWLTLDAPQVNVTVPIYMKKPVAVELDLSNNVLYTGGTNSENTELELSVGEVTVYGNEQVISKLEKITLTDKIDLSMYKDGDTFDLDITKDLGLGVYLDEDEASTVTVTVRMKGLSTTTIYVPAADVTIIHPDGYKAALTVSSIGVTLRGPSDRIRTVKAEHVTVIVDASNVNGNTDKAEYTVEMASGFEDFGATGHCTVNVVLRPQG